MENRRKKQQEKRLTPRHYDGSNPTSHHINQILPKVLSRITEAHQQGSDIIIASWPEVIGLHFATMAQAVAFNDGILNVKVNNSPALDHFRRDRLRILNNLRQKFPKVNIQNILFHIG